MKAAVVHELGHIPRVEQFPEVEPQNASQIKVRVLAASLKNIDKLRVSGAHYGSHATLPVVAGLDGVAMREDGRRVYTIGQSGMLAEYALVDPRQCVELPDGIDDLSAAALPNAVIGSASALRYRAQMKAGDVILINGATGVTGKIAVQVAKLYGASKVIATGRNAKSLERVRELGADEVVSLLGSDEEITNSIRDLHAKHPIDIVLDYTWGHPVELILKALQGGGLNDHSRVVKLVTIGQMASPTLQLASGTLRSTAIEILGSGFGSLSNTEIASTNREILPELFAMVVEGTLKIDTVAAPLERLPELWNARVDAGSRLVFQISGN